MCAGGAWAYSAAGTLESALAIFKNVEDGCDVLALSVQQLLDCTGGPNLGCVGGRRQYGFHYSTQKGMASESTYPFSF